MDEAALREQIGEVVSAAVAEAVKPLQEELDEAKGELAKGGRAKSALEKLQASSLPSAIHEDLLESLSGMEPEAQDLAITAEVAKLQKLNLRPVVRGAGDPVEKPEDLREQEGKFLGKVGLGDGSPVADPNETIWEFRERTRRQTA